MKLLTLLRFIGNLCLILGYCLILYVNFKIGLSIKFLGGFLIIPSLIKIKMWDGVLISSFFTIIEGARLIQLFINQ